jgi:filamentous hemagglutinin family protein
MQHKFSPLFKAIFLALNLGFSEAFANPTDGEVVAGNAAISNQPNNTLRIDQSTNKAIINWKTFDVAQHETVNFNTPGASAITLNRVTSGNASDIQGHINSNGQVWLINQNGVMFGKSSQVNVGGLLASTLDISNENFTKGNYTFKQSGA